MHAPLLDPGGVLDACLSASRAAAFQPLETVGFPLDPTWRDILVSTTILIAGLHHAACILATPGSVQPLAGMHAGSLLTCWRGFRQVGLEPFPVLTHWATTTNFMGLLPFPRFRAYLGATSAGFGADSASKARQDGACASHPGFRASLPVRSLNHISGLFANHDGRCVRVPSRDGRHNRRIDHP